MNDEPAPLSGAEYVKLSTFIREDPEQAWRLIPQFVRGSDPLEATAILEELVDLHCDGFLARLVEAATSDPTFADALATVHLGDMEGLCFDQLGEWQDRFRSRAVLPPDRPSPAA